MPSKLLFEKPRNNPLTLEMPFSDTSIYIYVTLQNPATTIGQFILPAFAGSRGANAGPAVPGRDVGPGDIYIYVCVYICI
jgi:hypothetical protein